MTESIPLSQNKGFTLIEIMVVIVIIGILAAIAIPQFNKYRAQGYVATVRSDVKNCYTAAEAYFHDNPGAVGIELFDCTSRGYQPSSIDVKILVGPGSVNTFTLTATHTNLNGSYVMQADGSVNDTLTAP